MIIPLKLGSIDYGALTSLCGASVPDAIKALRPRRLVTDSREVEKGDLFCALKGLKDGHSYTEEAARRGAEAVLAERKTNAPLPHIIVPSVRRALGDWSNGISGKDQLLRIGITGSVGKTTVKEAVACMLSPHFPIHATYGNFNNDLGLPFTILSAPHETKILICELGINRIGEMQELSRILRPHISVITCIGHAHIGAFGTRETIASEKLEILRYAEAKGTLFVPSGEKLLSRILPRGIKRISVTPFTEADYVHCQFKSHFEDTARNFALGYAKALGEHLGLSKDKIKMGLERILSLETHRHESIFLKMLFIDDGYNASPESMLGALRYLSSKSGERHVAVLGDMLELGEESDRYHRAVGRFAAKHAERLFFFGVYAKDYATGALAEGMCQISKSDSEKPGFSILSGERAEIAKQISAALRKGDTVLFKASRAQQIEKIIEEIKKQML